MVKRNFTPEALDRLWVADITYVRTWEGWLYLSYVLDTYSRRIVSWSMANHLKTELVLDAVNARRSTTAALSRVSSTIRIGAARADSTGGRNTRFLLQC